MSIDVLSTDRIPMSQKERDVLKILHGVIDGQRTQAQAAHLLKLSIRQVRRIQRKLEAGGDQALIHGLRGKPSNHRCDGAFRRAVLAAYRRRYHDFGPTFASEKLAEEGLVVSPQTLRRWLMEEGLWQRRRRRDPHRSRRPRRECFGELVQMDASTHDWLEGRGESMVLITMIDDATNYTMARFYPAGTTEAHMDLLERWLRRHGRPVAVYTDRHSIFEPQDKGRAVADGLTQFGRALSELSIELIRAHSPQAKGRVERSFGTAQDRWVKELRLAGVTSCEGGNTELERLLPAHNRRFSKPARRADDAHRPLGPGHDLAAVLSIQEERVVSNDYVVRFGNRHYQLRKPAYPGLRKGKVVVEQRRDGSLMIRFKRRYLGYDLIALASSAGGSAPRPPEFSALAADASRAEEQEGRDSSEESAAPGVQPSAGRSGRTPAEPYPPDGEAKDTAKGRRRPAKDHPWREPFKQQK
jgi:Winged helix-turn helix